MSDDAQPIASAPASARETVRARVSRARRVGSVLHNEIVGLHMRVRFAHLFVSLLPHFAFNRVRTSIYRKMGVRIGAGALILDKLELAGPGRIWERLSIGAASQITGPFYADLCAPITIGDRVYVGHHAIFVTTNHEIGSSEQRCGGWRAEPIRVENGAWIGANVTILPGVVVGKGAVVAAGAVVTKSVPANTLVGGVPAKLIRELDPA